MAVQVSESMRWPTTRETAHRLGVTQSRVRQLILDGTLRTERVGALHIVDPESLVAYERRIAALGRDAIGRIIDGRRRRWQPA